MAGDNGHGNNGRTKKNGTMPPETSGGNGGSASELPVKRHLRPTASELIAILDDHGVRQVPIRSEIVQAVEVVAGHLMSNESPRVRNMGAKLAMSMLRYNLAVYEFADHASRLDSGEPTENVAHVLALEFDR